MKAREERGQLGVVTQGIGVVGGLLFFALLALVVGGVLYLIVGKIAAIALAVVAIAIAAIIHQRHD